MSKNKKNLIRIIVSCVLFAAILVLYKFTPLKDFAIVEKDGFNIAEGIKDYRFWVYLLSFVAVYAVIGYDVVIKGVKNVFSAGFLDENFLMTIATVGAFFIADYPEAIAVMLFYQVGELFQSYAVGKSRKSITELMNICPETACVLRDGKEEVVSPDEVEVGEIIVVRAGEKFPLDGIVIEGSGSMDTSSLTGESVPRSFKEGDEVLSGSINLSGAVKVRSEKEFVDCTVSKILDLVENASSKKAKAENFITKFARYYTPAVVICAVVLAIIPPLFNGEWARWIETWLTFLVVSCPCALVISVPLSFFGGIGGASKQGILIKGGNYMEMLAKARTFVFDKTGTLTHGSFGVTKIYPEANKDEILRLAALCESGSLHPIARSIIEYAPKVSADGYALTEIAGKGIKAEKDGEIILCGNAGLLADNGVSFEKTDSIGSAVYLAKNGVYEGVIIVSDTVKENAESAIKKLKYQGARTVMLTGDGSAIAGKVAGMLGIDEYKAELLPQDKVAAVEELLKEKKSNETLCFVGDGINDAPVLSIADVGISMGGIGSDAAIEASDIVLMRDDLSKIAEAKAISMKTLRIVKQNIVFALAVKLAVLVLAVVNIPGVMWYAVFADVGVAVLAILNAMRTLRTK